MTLKRPVDRDWVMGSWRHELFADFVKEQGDCQFPSAVEGVQESDGLFVGTLRNMDSEYESSTAFI